MAVERKVAEASLSQQQLQEVEARLRQTAIEREKLEESLYLERAMKVRDRLELARRAAVTMPQAIQIALGQVPGSVLESRLLPENNDSAAYQIIIVNEAGNEIHTTKVIVSAVDGRILRVNK